MSRSQVDLPHRPVVSGPLVLVVGLLLVRGLTWPASQPVFMSATFSPLILALPWAGCTTALA